jgi:hypothetical protein
MNGFSIRSCFPEVARHAAQYITKLPKTEPDAEEWRAAMEISAN